MTNKPILKLKATVPSRVSELTSYFYDNELEDLIKNAVGIELLNIGLLGRFLPGFEKRLKEAVFKNINLGLGG